MPDHHDPTSRRFDDRDDDRRHDPDAPHDPRHDTPAGEPAPGELLVRGHRGDDPLAPAVILVDYRAPAPPRSERPRAPRPVSIGLAIDTSSSMGGAPVEAAREAARRLVDHLGRRDTISVTTFGGDVQVLLDGVRADRDGREVARRAIEGVRAGGMTPLHPGWRTTAEILEQATCHPRADRVAVVLSDGMGNQGETDPPALSRDAAALRSWDVRTTCVGIGDQYHSGQLAALAEGGGGALHQASEPGEIVDAVLGELRRVRAVTLRGTVARVELPAGLRVIEVVGGRRHRRVGPGAIEVELGDLGPERPTTFAILIDRASLEVGGDVVVRIDGASDDGPVRRVARHRRPIAEVLAGPDRVVAGCAASLWHDEVVRGAIERNEDHDYDGAGDVVARVRGAILALAVGTDEERDLHRSIEYAERRVRHLWAGPSRKEAHASVMRRKAAFHDARGMAYEQAAMHRLAAEAEAEGDENEGGEANVRARSTRNRLADFVQSEPAEDAPPVGRDHD